MRVRHLVLAFAAVVPLTGCGERGDAASVVVYASVDRHYAEPVLERFEEESGIRVEAVYDVEASKTTGLVVRLLAEKDNPRADVFWNGEFAQTLRLAGAGVLAPYVSPAAADVPAAFRDPDGLWIGFGGRARIIAVNRARLGHRTPPSSLADLVSPAWDPDEVGLSLPLFGTGATHAAALYARDGEVAARAFYARLAKRGVRMLDGNAMVRDHVVAGTLTWGVTDTDDACAAIGKGADIDIVVPDQGAEEGGTLVVPNTVALVAGGPSPDAGRALVDYLVSPETGRELVAAGWTHTPVRNLGLASPCPLPKSIKAMEVDLARVQAAVAGAIDDLKAIFLR